VHSPWHAEGQPELLPPPPLDPPEFVDTVIVFVTELFGVLAVAVTVPLLFVKTKVRALAAATAY